jgi:hypothetical protein
MAGHILYYGNHYDEVSSLTAMIGGDFEFNETERDYKKVFFEVAKVRPKFLIIDSSGQDFKELIHFVGIIKNCSLTKNTNIFFLYKNEQELLTYAGAEKSRGQALFFNRNIPIEDIGIFIWRHIGLIPEETDVPLAENSKEVFELYSELLVTEVTDEYCIAETDSYYRTKDRLEVIWEGAPFKIPCKYFEVIKEENTQFSSAAHHKYKFDMYRFDKLGKTEKQQTQWALKKLNEGKKIDSDTFRLYKSDLSKSEGIKANALSINEAQARQEITPLVDEARLAWRYWLKENCQNFWEKDLRVLCIDPKMTLFFLHTKELMSSPFPILLDTHTTDIVKKVNRSRPSLIFFCLNDSLDKDLENYRKTLSEIIGLNNFYPFIIFTNSGHWNTEMARKAFNYNLIFCHSGRLDFNFLNNLCQLYLKKNFEKIMQSAAGILGQVIMHNPALTEKLEISDLYPYRYRPDLSTPASRMLHLRQVKLIGLNRYEIVFQSPEDFGEKEIVTVKSPVPMQLQISIHTRQKNYYRGLIHAISSENLLVLEEYEKKFYRGKK